MPFELAVNLRAQAPVADIESVQVQTYYMAYSEIGSEPQKWEPKTRETADHSLPYLLALAFADGRITPASFDERASTGPALSFMPRIKIAENPDFTRQFPAARLAHGGHDPGRPPPGRRSVLPARPHPEPDD